MYWLSWAMNLELAMEGVDIRPLLALREFEVHLYLFLSMIIELQRTYFFGIDIHVVTIGQVKCLRC